MTDIEQKRAAKDFAERWKDRGYEKGESKKYWIASRQTKQLCLWEDTTMK